MSFGKDQDPNIGKKTRLKLGCKKVAGSGMKKGYRFEQPGEASIRRMLSEMMPEQEQKRRWRAFLNHPSVKVRWFSFKLAISYLYGRPAKSPVNAGDQPTGQSPDFDFSDIPTGNTPIQ